MDNKEVLKENGGKKWDIVLMNPPYAHSGSDTIHLKFVDKCIDISKNQIVVMPFNFVQKVNNKALNQFKEKFTKYLENVEEISGDVFKDTHMPSVGIYVFNKDKKENSNIKIQYIYSGERQIKSLFDIADFSNYEREIIKYLENQGSQDILGDCGRLNNWKRQVSGLDGNKKEKKILELVENSLKKVKKYYNEHKNSVGLLVNRSNGACNGTAMSSKNGQILTSYNEFVNYFCNHLLAIGYNALMFKSKKEAENCKIALQNPLLRLTLFKLQDDQNMVPRIYKYIPAINWEDDRVKTDEGLLEVCGCPNEKIKEYVEYCKKLIDKVDNKKSYHIRNNILESFINE